MFAILFFLARIATIGWVLMILFPTRRVTRSLVREGIFPLYLCVLYAIGVLAIFSEMVPDFIRVKAELSIMQVVLDLMKRPEVAVVFWLHILAFDQVVGLYIYEDNMANHYLSMPVQSVVLTLTLFVGPIGFMLYLLLRTPARLAMRRSAQPVAGGAVPSPGLA